MTDAEYLKQWLKSRGWKYRDVAQGVYRSVSWIGDVVRGNYPWFRGGPRAQEYLGLGQGPGDARAGKNTMSDFYHTFHNAVFRHPDPDPIAECESDGMAQQIAALLNGTPAAYTVAEKAVVAAAYGLREAKTACDNGLAVEYVYTARRMLEDAALKLVVPGTSP